MRSAQKSNRSRGRGNRKGGNSGGNNINRVYDSAGPEGKVRGTPQQIIDKYLSLARDAQTSGDRVAAENFLQHAEHYQRILIQANASQEQARREAQEAATDQAADRGNEAMAQPEAVAVQPQPQGQQPQPQPQGMPQPDLPVDAAPIGGMTTIDSGPTEQPALLVEGDDIAKSQPRRNGEGRTRRPRQRAEAPKPAPEAAAEAPAAEQPDTAPSPAEG